MGRGFKGIILGGAIGAALGILYAPRAGKITREMLAEKTDKFLGEDAQQGGTFLGGVAKTTKSAVEAGQNMINDMTSGKFSDFSNEARNKSQEFFNSVDEKVVDFTNSSDTFNEKNDELRRKIDNARQKIASQVKKNIDEHKMENSNNNSFDVEPKSVKTHPIDEEL